MKKTLANSSPPDEDSLLDKDFYDRFLKPLANKQKEATASQSKDLAKLELIMDKFVVDFLAAHIKTHDELQTRDLIKFEALAERYGEVGESLADVANQHRDLVMAAAKDRKMLLEISEQVEELTMGLRYLAATIVNLSDAMYSVSSSPLDEDFPSAMH